MQMTLENDGIVDLRPPELQTDAKPWEPQIVDVANRPEPKPAPRPKTRRERAPAGKRIDLEAPLGFFRRNAFSQFDQKPAWHVVGHRNRYIYTALCGYEYDDMFGEILKRASVRTANMICAKCAKKALELEAAAKEVPK